MESPSDPEEFGDIVRIQVNLLRIIQEFRFGFYIEPAENQVLVYKSLQPIGKRLKSTCEKCFGKKNCPRNCLRKMLPDSSLVQASNLEAMNHFNIFRDRKSCEIKFKSTICFNFCFECFVFVRCSVMFVRNQPNPNQTKHQKQKNYPKEHNRTRTRSCLAIFIIL